jgi:surfactin synthase thioesterase subunit
MRLLCFHCAGGSSSMFKRWRLEGIQVIPFDLPGRGKQVDRPMIEDFHEATDYLVAQVETTIQDGKPWGVFGHSMGALFAYEVTRRLQNRNPIFRILSGINPLQEYKGVVRVTKEDDSTLMQKMAALGGIPDHLQRHPMFIKWFAPIIRADLSLVETFVFQKEFSPIPTYVINGDDDRIIDKTKIHLWNECMNQAVSIEMIKGDHFEILKHPEIISNLVSKYIQVGVIVD